MTDYYKILEVPRNASLEEIKSAFRRLAQKYHPDVSSMPNSRELFIEINEAYNYLVNKIKIENELKENSNSNYNEIAQTIIDSWIATERERIRARACKYADYKFSRFRYTKIYRTTEFLSKWLSIGTFIFGILVLIVSLIATLNYLFRNKKVDLTYLMSSIIIIFLGVLITTYSAFKIYAIYKSSRK